MPELLTMQDLANGHLDVKALGEAANGDENTIVTTRTGNTYPSAERAINIMFQNGGLPAEPFPTLAKMQTDGASLADGQLAMVYNETTNNGLYVKTAGVWFKSAYDPVTQARQYAELQTGIVFNADTAVVGSTEYRASKAIKSLSLSGNYNDRIITLASMSYANGVFTIVLASPSTLDEVMGRETNTKYIARYSAPTTFSGVQKLKLSAFGELAITLNTSGTITIDFDELITSDLFIANYVAKNRLISSRDIINLNATYDAIKSIENSVRLVIGSDKKNEKLNAAIEELVFFKPIPATKFMILAGMFYGASDPTLVHMQIFQSDDKITKGTLWAQGAGTIVKDNKCLVIFDQGYAIVNMDNYYPSNVGAAALSDNATYETRGINRTLIKSSTLDSTVTPQYPTQFVQASTFSLPLDYLQRSVKLYIKGDIAPTDYYLLSVFNWSFTNGKYRLTYQVRKMAAPTDLLTTGSIVYHGFLEFDNIADIKGMVTVTPPKTNGQTQDAEIDIDFKYLPYRTDNNNFLSPMIFNPPNYTFATHGFDIQKLRRDSSQRFKSMRGGLPQYNSLKDALDAKEVGLFAVGGNTFKARNTNPLTKDDILCVNNPPKLMSRKPKTKNYDFFYKNVKVRLEQIDSDDNFYFLNAGVIVKSPHPMKQTWTSVASAAAADLVVFDISANAYFSIPDHAELFTAASLAVPTISFMRLTYDEELLIIAIDKVRVIMFTENNQSSLRTFNFNGSVGTKYAFGAGVNIVKDWCMSHHKNVMFFSDYDSGVIIDGTNVRGTTGGQKCYVSLDNGYTFTKCFDFTGSDWSRVTNAANITAFGASQAHIHSVSYDPKQNVVWITTGDGAVSRDNASFFYSRDLGLTWTHFRSSIVDTGQKSQMIMALPFDGCVAFGSDDNSLNGVGVITYNGNSMVHEVASQVISKNDLLAFARSTWHSQKYGVKYISFGQDSQKTTDPDAKSFVVASSNGYTWERIWDDNNAAIYGNVFCYDDTGGNVYISLDGIGVYKDRVVVVSTGFI